MLDKQEVHVVAMAGGAGTRFWPLSRSHRPKHLLPWLGGESLLSATLSRVSSIAPGNRRWMVVGESHADACSHVVPEFDKSRILIEPVARNTAAAIALAAVNIRGASSMGSDAVMVVLPADHHVRDAPSLCQALGRAVALAEHGTIVTLGIAAAYPEVGYGYIERGRPLDGVEGAFRVSRFREKPDAQTAKTYVKAGNFDWNAGIFVMRVGTYLDELKAQMPEHAAAFEQIANDKGNLASAYQTLESISVDYGIMEGAKNVVVVPTECGWSDVGSFRAMADIVAATVDADSNDNSVTGHAIVRDCHGCFVQTDDTHAVAVVGLNDVAVIHTDDGTLVVPLDRAQEVKAIVDELRNRGWDRYL